MPVDIALDSASKFLDWLRAGARLIDGTVITEVRDASTDKPTSLRGSNWTEQVLPNLLGPDFAMDVSTRKGRVDLQICYGREDDGSSRHECPWLARISRVFIDTFAPIGLIYARACSYDEWFHRNLLKTHTPWARRPSTSPVGTDIERYVPGLYWMNFLSRPFAERHRIDLESVSRQLGARAESIGDGYLLVLFGSPGDWQQHASRVDQAIRSHRGFFSLDLIPRRPITHPRELSEYFEEVQKHWS